MMNQIDKTFHISTIIYHYLNDTISEEENTILQSWLEEDSNHYKVLERFSKAEYLKQKDEEYQLFEPHKGFERFRKDKKQIDHKRFIRQWTTVAAIMIGACGIALAVFFSNMKQPTSEPISLTSVGNTPGISRATLVLNDGKQIILSDTSEVQLEQSSANIHIAHGNINYQSQDSVKELCFNDVIIPRGGEFSLKLSDGTKVWLNAETELKYPVVFGPRQREVWLKGEAYFEVAKDQHHPFIVRTNNLNIQVLGTSFNVKAYPDEIENATLVEGKIKVSTDQQKYIIHPGEQLSYSHGKIEIRKVDVRAYIAWKNQRFAFMDDPLEDVLRKLERWYDVEFLIRNTAIREYRFTGILPKYENLDKVLKKLELTTCIHFIQQGHSIIVEKD